MIKKIKEIEHIKKIIFLYVPKKKLVKNIKPQINNKSFTNEDLSPDIIMM